MSDTSVIFSAGGRRRQEEILALALRQARRQRRGRLARGLAAVSAAVLLLATLALVRIGRWPAAVPSPAPILVQQQSPTPLPAAPRVESPAPIALPPPATGIVIVRIETDPDILRRLAIPPQEPTWKRLTDDELLEELSAAGRPAALARIDGQAVLILGQDVP